MNDNFERLDLIRRLSEIRSHYNCFNEKERKVYHTLSEAIEALQEQKTGKWIINEEEKSTASGSCSVCGWQAHLYEDDVVGMNFCPNCGSYNGGEG